MHRKKVRQKKQGQFSALANYFCLHRQLASINCIQFYCHIQSLFACCMNYSHGYYILFSRLLECITSSRGHYSKTKLNIKNGVCLQKLDLCKYLCQNDVASVLSCPVFKSIDFALSVCHLLTVTVSSSVSCGGQLCW